MNYLKQNHLSILIIVWLVASAILGGHSALQFGANTVSENGKPVINFTNPIHAQDRVTLEASSTIRTLKIGELGSQTTRVVKGTCAITGNRSVTASSTGAFDCVSTATAGVPAWAAGDMCIAQAASTTQASTGFSIVGCSASTTAGYVTLLIVNESGTAAVVPYPIASTTNFLFAR